MAATVQSKSPRQEFLRTPIAQAFAISFVLHIVVILGIEVGREAGLWKTSVLPQRIQNVLQEVRKQSEQEKQVALPELRPENDIPLVFVEVDPKQAVTEAPKNTKFYSTANTRASNPDPAKDLNTPKIEGKQQEVPRTFDVMRPSATPEQPQPKPELKPEPKKEAPQNQQKTEPAPQVAPQPPEPQSEPPAKPRGDEDIQVAEELKARESQAKQAAKPPPAEPPKRPRTLAEARAQKGIVVGPKMKQEGGVPRHSIGTNLDVASSPFGSYDAAFIAAVQARWFQLIEERGFTYNESGRVVLEFRLNKDGRITEMKVAETEVTDMLGWFCQRAVLDPAPYQPFPTDLRRLLNKDYRDVRFTFYYNR